MYVSKLICYIYSVPLNLLPAVWRYIFKKYFLWIKTLSLSFSLFLYTPVNSQWFQRHGTGMIHTSTLINSFTFVLMKRSCNSLHSATDIIICTNIFESSVPYIHVLSYTCTYYTNIISTSLHSFQEKCFMRDYTLCKITELPF